MGKLSTSQLARLSRLLDEIVDADEAARRQWLAALAAEHRDLEPALRRALLPEGQEGHDDPLARPPRLTDAAPDTPTTDGLRDGDRVGPYRLVRRLGSGGMAEVWLAQRCDGAFHREVALKRSAKASWREDLA